MCFGPEPIWVIGFSGGGNHPLRPSLWTVAWGINMVDYNLDRFSILVVEDSPFMRSMIMNSLKILGAGTVNTCDDGGAAIEFLQLVHSDPMKAGVQSIDFIISNWVMSPVDGMMLLRWVRRHKESKDRFIPFIMLTGYAAVERVHEARDLGVTEFLSKPYSITALSRKIVSVIERPRQFVHNRDYFGPDRRRADATFDGANKRQLTDKSETVEIVRG